MQRAVVTGGRGEVGVWVTQELIERGWDVTVVDLSNPDPGYTDVGDPALDFRGGDLTDQGTAWELIQTPDPDVVIHLAAIPRNGVRSGTETFDTNVTATYNVLQAGARAGARGILASSHAVFGPLYASDTYLPEYFPIDETHLCRPEDPYGTSKLVGEEIAKMMVRRHEISIASIRPVRVAIPGNYDWFTEYRQEFDPTSAEKNTVEAGGYWSYVDARDVATLIADAATGNFDGHEAFIAAATENYLNRPTEEVIEEVFGSLPDNSSINDKESAYTTEKAQKLLGWDPDHTWREAENENVDTPWFASG